MIPVGGLLEQRAGLASLQREPGLQQQQAAPQLLLFGATLQLLQQVFEIVNFAPQLLLGRQAAGVRENPVGDAQGLGHRAVVVERQRLAGPGHTVNFAQYPRRWNYLEKSGLC